MVYRKTVSLSSLFFLIIYDSTVISWVCCFSAGGEKKVTPRKTMLIANIVGNQSPLP